MKTIIFLSIFLCSLYGISITEDKEFQKLITPKENQKKLVLMFYTTKTCPQCAYMKQKVFEERKVKQFMKEHFVIMYKDINRDELPNGFEYFGIPTMFFIDHNGKQVSKIVGSSRAEPFLAKLRSIQEKNK